jgi:hypothetical protein
MTLGITVSSVIVLNVIMLSDAFSFVMRIIGKLSVEFFIVTLSVIMVSVVMVNVFILSVVAPFRTSGCEFTQICKNYFFRNFFPKITFLRNSYILKKNYLKFPLRKSEKALTI